MPFLRKVVFYLFIAVYCLICPMLIARLLGFVFDPTTRRWAQTGIICVSSNPPDALVFLNGKKAHEHTPTVIRDLTPGGYDVRMELDGYVPWANTVPVVNKKATTIENILLIPRQWDIKQEAASPSTNLIGIPGGNCLLALNGEGVRNILILHPNDGEEPEHLFPSASVYREGKLARYFTSAQSPFLVMQVDLGEKSKYLWLDTREKQAHIEDISDLITQEPERLYWEPADDKTIYAFFRASVSRINIKAKAIYPNIDEKTVPPEKKKKTPENTPAADQVYLINNDNTFLFRVKNDVFLSDALFISRARLTKILTVKAGTEVCFLEKTGKLYFIDASSNRLTSMTILEHKPFIPKPIAEKLRLKKTEE